MKISKKLNFALNITLQCQISVDSVRTNYNSLFKVNLRNQNIII